MDDQETTENQQGKGYGHQRASREDTQEQQEGIKDLVTKDAIIVSGDPEKSTKCINILLTITGNGPEVLTERTKDDWSCTYMYCAGAMKSFMDIFL